MFHDGMSVSGPFKKAAGSLCLVFTLAAFGPGAAPADAAAGKQRRRPPAAAVKKPQPQAQRYAHIVIDGASGKVLSESHADEKRNMASLTKIMTLLMTFDALEKGTLQLNQKIPVSSHAARQATFNVELKAGQEITVEDLIKAITVHSANDAAVVLAEALGGTEANFAKTMTAKAKDWGIDAEFVNASGMPNRDVRGRMLPDQNETTALGMALLARKLVTDYSAYYHYFSETAVTINGKPYKTHDYLLTGNKAKKIKAYDGMDGGKTGYISASGYNLVALALRDGKRVIGVVFGAPSDVVRARIMTGLLDDGFDKAAQEAKAPEPLLPPP